MNGADWYKNEILHPLLLALSDSRTKAYQNGKQKTLTSEFVNGPTPEIRESWTETNQRLRRLMSRHFALLSSFGPGPEEFSEPTSFLLETLDNVEKKLESMFFTGEHKFSDF